MDDEEMAETTTPEDEMSEDNETDMDDEEMAETTTTAEA
jgi:hypothetical protein